MPICRSPCFRQAPIETPQWFQAEQIARQDNADYQSNMDYSGLSASAIELQQRQLAPNTSGQSAGQ